ncbi:PaaX family transcriptional regulator C-terminal domain-containing protein [Parenemella sanctibonifatiensis]|uniref:PaaX family transcriptional regulator n=1 Tax=Parenemella sanctibonifatiensis TaxID=2016505 RepID=A0A255EER9_9ACTN|nr:PaaX family transcriptional regulator C-terminal domain-containing protein [Parenemella sanctibonifatiensis]OYN90048.1 hypothetical protein CGZ92_02135 [Parenemella sanctibonifatiensis]
MGEAVFTSAYARVPFLFDCATATALPGPLLLGWMDQLGVNRQSAKSQLHRMVEQGHLTVERHGRVGQYRLHGAMETSFRQIRDGEQAEDAWDGLLHQITYDVAEVHRPVRERLRHRAFAHLYGMVRPGVLVSPVDKSAALTDLMDEVAEVGLIVTGWVRYSLEDARQVAAAAWDLASFAKDYRSLAAAAEAIIQSSTTGVAILNEIYDLTLRRVRLHRFDPQLPTELLPTDWPAAAALAAYERAAVATGPRLGEHIATGLSGTRYRSLVELEPDSPYAALLG